MNPTFAIVYINIGLVVGALFLFYQRSPDETDYLVATIGSILVLMCFAIAWPLMGCWMLRTWHLKKSRPKSETEAMIETILARRGNFVPHIDDLTSLATVENLRSLMGGPYKDKACALDRLKLPDDELWHFSASGPTTKHEGICLVRNGVPIEGFWTRYQHYYFGDDIIR